MAGTLVTLLQKSDLNFTAAGATTNTQMVLARALDVTPFREGVVVLRAHAAHSTGTGQTLVLKAFNTAPTAEDPAYEFVAKFVLFATQTNQNTDFTGSISAEVTFRE